MGTGVTRKQKEIMVRLTSSLKEADTLVELKNNIRKENEYFERKRISQTPTRKQWYQTYNI